MRRELNKGERKLYRALYDHRSIYTRLLKTATKRRDIVEVMLADADRQMAEFKGVVYGAV